jgi:hypothetical protein
MTSAVDYDCPREYVGGALYEDKVITHVSVIVGYPFSNIYLFLYSH